MSENTETFEMPELKPVYSCPDGSTFETKAEAQEYMRRPIVLKALNELTENNEDLSQWLLDQKSVLQDAFSTGTIKRVTKSERKAFGKEMDSLLEMAEKNGVKVPFVREHHSDIVEGFKYPTAKRMDSDEKMAAIKNTILGVSEGNEEVVDWVIANKDAVFTAYDAGKPKRQVSKAAEEGLRKYREQQAKLKAQKEAEAAAAAETEAAE